MSKSLTTTIETPVPTGLLKHAQKLVDVGWFGSLDEVVVDALRRFLESHRQELMEEFIRQDAVSGFSGTD